MGNGFVGCAPAQWRRKMGGISAGDARLSQERMCERLLRLCLAAITIDLQRMDVVFGPKSSFELKQ